MPAIVFDLDETLLDTSALREVRHARRWHELAGRLDEVIEYENDGSAVRATELPALARDSDYRVGVFTQSPRWYAERLLDAFEMPCDALITGSDEYAPKPDPSGLFEVTEKLGATIEECVMVGDDAADIKAAQNAKAFSVGVAWSRRAPAGWRRTWPDIAIARPDRLLGALANRLPRLPYGEARLAETQPLWHWGSLLRLGKHTFGMGRYYTVDDGRHPSHALSRLVIEAKEGPAAAERVGELLSDLLVGHSAILGEPDLITSVPPKPDRDYDRFGAVRAAASNATSFPERGDLLRQVRDDPDYRHIEARDRPARAAGRFASKGLQGERVLLIDDVITSGGQSDACRDALMQAGASSVVILALGVTQDTLPRPCPTCGGFLRLIRGSRGPFVGCSNYFTARRCPYTEDAPSV